tara:strand:+ start:4016 stop:5599 length:1584 start_codon:yes stop_codon:yes gene_type:complete
MSSSGLKRGNFSSVSVAYGMGVGTNRDEGTIGKVLTSNGTGKSMSWTSKGTLTQERLSAGTDITMVLTSDGTTPKTFYDGSEGITIRSVDTDTGYTAGDGITIDTSTNPDTIKTDNDGTTIDHNGGTGNQNQVLKVPYSLTITGGSPDPVVYDGGTSNKSVDVSANDNVSAGYGITITGDGSTATPYVIATNNDETTIRHNSGTNKNEVIKVPQTLTITQNSVNTIYDGSTAKTITIDTNNDDIDAGDGITITGDGSTANPYIIKTDNDGTTLGYDEQNPKQNKVIKVPNKLIAGSNITMTGGLTEEYDGSTAITINATTDGGNEENSCYCRFSPSSQYNFPNPATQTWYAGGYGFTAFATDFYVDIPLAIASSTAYQNFKVIVSVYEEERIYARKGDMSSTDNRNGLIDFVDASGTRISPVYFFQSGGGLSTQSNNPPTKNSLEGGRGNVVFSCILSMPPNPTTAVRVQPRFSNNSITDEGSSHHLFQAGVDGNYSVGGETIDINKVEWIIETHPINPSNFRNITS